MLYVPLFFYIFESLTEKLRGHKGPAHSGAPPGEHAAEHAPGAEERGE
jgi:hypothetical protein